VLRCARCALRVALHAAPHAARRLRHAEKKQATPSQKSILFAQIEGEWARKSKMAPPIYMGYSLSGQAFDNAPKRIADL
jgi:hypothetical protein